MTEVFFPLLGPLLVVAAVLPACALVAKAALVAIGRLARGDALHTYQALRHAIVVSSSGVPLLWFISAGIHQAETGRAGVCAGDHGPESLCMDAAYFAAALSVVAAVAALPRLLREGLAARTGASAAANGVQVRVDALIERQPGLAALRGRAHVRDRAPAPMATVGIVAPRVVIRTSFAAALDDDTLAAALVHELSHARGRDPLRYFLASWALSVNPLGRRLLEAELARWVLAREAHCDREAVLAGASAPALAQALVRAARPAGRTPGPALGPANADAVKLRVGLLLAYTERTPGRCCPEPSLRLSLVPLLAALAVAHGGSTAALDAVHVASEAAVSFVLEPR